MKRFSLTMNNSTSFRSSRQGSIIVLVAVSLPILLVFAAFIVDVAWMSSIQTEAQMASDLATRGALTAFVSDRSEDSYDARVARAQAIGKTLFENINIGQDFVKVDAESFVFGELDRDGEFRRSSKGTANAVELDLDNVKEGGFGLFLAPMIGFDTYNASSRTVVGYKPIDVVLCLDISRSMAYLVGANRPPDSIGTIHAPPVEGSRWIALVDSVRGFLKKAEEQAPSLRISLVTFGGGEFRTVETPWDETATRTMTDFEFIGPATAPIEKALDEISSDILGWVTPTRDGLELVRGNFSSGSLDSTQKVCILLSDGRSTPRTGDPVTKAEDLNSDRITIHTIYFSGDVKGVPEMEAIAEKSSGLFLNASDTTELNNAFEEILAQINVSIVE